ncbi:MAG: winged helix DNA-binding domain-containing protein, partial [Pyrinomonadaceae bacterium]
MSNASLREIPLWRMRNQYLDGPSAESPTEVVRRLGAVQAQDYYGSLWAIGQRTVDPNKAAIEAAIAARQIVRSWPMRGTLHFVAGQDLRWMLRLLAPRILQQHAARIQRDLELDATSMAAARKVVVRELEQERVMTRPALYQALENAGIYAGGSRGIHIFWSLAQEGVICMGAHSQRQPTVTLLDDWLPPSRMLEGDEALAELALRYFTGHGPATIQDLTWWSGLAAAQARQALELVKRQLEPLVVGERMYWHAGFNDTTVIRARIRIDLLPAYDEFTVGYADRSPIMSTLGPNVGRGRVIFHPVVTRNGQVIANWQRFDRKGEVELVIKNFAGAPAPGRRALDAVIRRYGDFLGTL